jgi:outer membrane protein assembly factor BamB
MYVTTHASTMALDLVTGRQIWKTLVDYPADTPRVACCGIVNRGVALYEGKVFRTTLDAETGNELWRTQSIDHKTGYSMTVAPMMADGVLITGISGGEYGIVAISKGMILTPECGSGVPIPFLLRENRAVRHGRMVGMPGRVEGHQRG